MTNLFSFLSPTSLSVQTPPELKAYGWTTADLWCAPAVTGFYALLTHAQPYWAGLHSILSGVLGSTSIGEPVKPLDPETARAVCALLLSGLFLGRTAKNFGLWKSPFPQKIELVPLYHLELTHSLGAEIRTKDYYHGTIGQHYVSLEKQITKTLAEYIDRAITSPPKHQPFADFIEFLQNWQSHTAGIDTKQVYKSKLRDPSWLKEHDDHAGDRDSYPSTPDLSPFLFLDTVYLKYVPQKKFKDILFHIANATERAVCSRSPKDPNGCDHVFGEFTKKTFNINMHQEYHRRSDDPHWLPFLLPEIARDLVL
ncbi:hypothetical protein CVT25_008355 [Psilocybe cyanescens]|uniref:Uncharacterized protein n=1 Tax=Psilocybe cyanescens TaxID=93625 RepID=A0A409WV37_PSICY|nr:hypothetical protein CVT25_008355 [Psilocybe cyanescens]